MPIYVYKCRTCGHEHEQLVLKAEDLPKGCPMCDGPLARQVTSAAVAINGYSAANGYSRKEA